MVFEHLTIPSFNACLAHPGFATVAREYFYSIAPFCRPEHLSGCCMLLLRHKNVHADVEWLKRLMLSFNAALLRSCLTRNSGGVKSRRITVDEYSLEIYMRVFEGLKVIEGLSRILREYMRRGAIPHSSTRTAGPSSPVYCFRGKDKTTIPYGRMVSTLLQKTDGTRVPNDSTSFKARAD